MRHPRPERLGAHDPLPIRGRETIQTPSTTSAVAIAIAIAGARPGNTVDLVRSHDGKTNNRNPKERKKKKKRNRSVVNSEKRRAGIKLGEK